MQKHANIIDGETLSAALADHFDRPAHPPLILPENIQEAVLRIFMQPPFGPGYWMDLNASERRAVAFEWDEAQTPAKQGKHPAQPPCN